MPPKKGVLKKETNIVRDENRLYEVDRAYFEIQFKEFEKKIARLNDGSKILENDIETFKNKTIKLNEKFEKEFKFAQKNLKEKENHEIKLKKEIEDLLNESKSSAGDHENKMAELHNQFIVESRKIKSKTSVFVGRLNKFEEYLKQEKMLEQKLAHTKETIRVMSKNYEVKMKNIEVKKYETKKAAQKSFVKRCVDFAEQIHSNQDPALIQSFLELNDVVDQLKTSERLRTELEKEYADAQDVANKGIASSKISCRKRNVEKSRVYSIINDTVFNTNEIFEQISVNHELK